MKREFIAKNIDYIYENKNFLKQGHVEVYWWSTICIAYVFINTKSRYEHLVYTKLIDEDTIDELQPLFHHKTFDMVAKITSLSQKNLHHFIKENIHDQKGVVETKTFS